VFLELHHFYEEAFSLKAGQWKPKRPVSRSARTFHSWWHCSGGNLSMHDLLVPKQKPFVKLIALQSEVSQNTW